MLCLCIQAAGLFLYKVVRTGDGSVSVFYKIWERLPLMLPDMSSHPLMAALIGGAFVGVGVGIIVRMGGSSGGDDALALSISHMTGWRLSRAYLLTDVTVLLLSLTYIPIGRIIFFPL